MTDIFIPILMSLIAGLSTGIGGIIGVFKKVSMKYFDILVGFASGVMISVATLGLIEESYSLIVNDAPVYLILIVILSGVSSGVIFLLILDKYLPHLHASGESKEQEKKFNEIICDKECVCPYKDRWHKCPYLKDGKCTLHGGYFCPKKIEFQRKMRYSGILLAIGLTLHNSPEGIAVGVGFLASSSLGFSMVIAIALHNIPEGLAISMPLLQGNYTKLKSFMISLLSGLAEPISCLIAVLFLQNVSFLILSFFLAFAGGAMLYVTSDELIPESHKHGFEHEATIGILLGFLLMLVLIIGFGM